MATSYTLNRLKKEIEDLKRDREELLEFAEEVRRAGDTRLASMAIAVIAKAKVKYE